MSRGKATKNNSFLMLSDELRNCELWPAADVTFEDDEDKERFDRMAKGIRLYLRNGALSAAAKEAGCARSTLLEALDRCLQPRNDSSQGIVGWAGLIRGLWLNGYKRTKPTTGKQGSGKGGSFEQFLEARPTFRKKLDAIIRAGGGEPGAKSASPVGRGVWKKWARYCLANGVTENDYPFNTKSKGRRSVERYIQRRIAEDAATSRTWLGADTSDTRNIGTGKRSFPFSVAPFDIVAMDTHRVDAIGTVTLDGPAGPQEVAVERFHLHVVIDLHTGCALGYSVSYATQINAVAIEDALLCLATPWKPRALTTEGLSYIPGAALPVGNIPGLDEIRPCAVAFDNAAQHFANRFLEGIRKQWGCAMNAIPIGSWPRNAAIERVFRTVEQWVFHQLPSSTGSHPTDPLKPDSVQGALKHHISWEQLVDLVDVLLANYNASKTSAMDGQTRLQALSSFLRSSKAPLVLRPSIAPTAHTPRLGITVEKRPVRGSLKKGAIRTPYVEVDKLRYSGPGLAKNFELIGEYITLHIDERDMRTVTAFDPSGESLGELAVLNRRWGQTKHSRALRKTINGHVRNGDFSPDGSDIVLSFLSFLARNARKQMTARPKNVSGAATQLVEASRTTGVPITEIGKAAGLGLPPIPHRPLPSRLPPPKWRNT